MTRNLNELPPSLLRGLVVALLREVGGRFEVTESNSADVDRENVVLEHVEDTITVRIMPRDHTPSGSPTRQS